ncbi:DUF3489 domain-containing protein [Tabrizicola soli]|uniref:DUF3489 domain-containing protein n=1 Tax=Tabrizicola soli TaxID=2185115 RepID=A0ABV7DRJ2_9RHOB|nr:DUF3489 domain-containing protein [Tabrizicola soli]
MTTRKHNTIVPDTPPSERSKDAANSDDTTAAIPAVPKAPQPPRRGKDKATTRNETNAPAASEDEAPNGAALATGVAVANSLPQSKLDRLLIRLRQPGGATISDLMDATGWQAHSVRGAIAGALRKKGHTVVSGKTDGGERRYRLQGAP